VDAAPPEPLEVIGPLSVEPGSAYREQKRLVSQPPPERGEPQFADEAGDTGRRGASKQEGLPPSQIEEEAQALRATRGEPTPAPHGASVERHRAKGLAEKSMAAPQVPARGRLRVDAGGGRVFRGTFTTTRDIARGVYPVVVEVVSGRVVAARVPAGTDSTDHRRVAERLVGTTVADAMDGVFAAEAVVN